MATPNLRTGNARKTGRFTPCQECKVRALEKWNWPRILDLAREVTAREGHLPPAPHFQKHGMAMLVQSVYQHGKTWADLRTELDAFEGSSFVASRSGLRFRSHPEASLSNFLFARGIRHEKGRKYPAEYAASSGRTYGYYDLTFCDEQGRLIDVEVWGDKPHGHGEAEYALKRAAKERFNAGRSTFLGIQFQDCFDDAALNRILEPLIGVVEPHVFLEPHDSLVESSHWSNADELLISCRAIADAQPDGKFPPEDWLRKRGNWAARDGPVYNTVSVYIKTWLGGVREVRRLLGQGHNSTEQWTRERALAELQAWYAQYGKSPGAVRYDVEVGKLRLSDDEFRRAARISAAVQKYAGGAVQACHDLGIAPSRRSPRRS